MCMSLLKKKKINILKSCLCSLRHPSLRQCFLLGSCCVTLPDVEVGRGTQRGHEGVRGGGRLGDGPRLWGTSWILSQDAGGSHSRPFFACFRMTCRSRSRGGERRPSRGLDARSTSGRRRRGARLWAAAAMRCAATGTGSETSCQIFPNMGNTRRWRRQTDLKLCRTDITPFTTQNMSVNADFLLPGLLSSWQPRSSDL